jgi:hypothetical protein
VRGCVGIVSVSSIRNADHRRSGPAGVELQSCRSVAGLRCGFLRRQSFYYEMNFTVRERHERVRALNLHVIENGLRVGFLLLCETLPSRHH